LERGAKVRLFEQMRREYEHGVGTVKGVAKKFGVHRRLVRQALEKSLPPERKRPERSSPKVEVVKGFIEEILKEDKRAPRKQDIRPYWGEVSGALDWRIDGTSLRVEPETGVGIESGRGIRTSKLQLGGRGAGGLV